MQPVASAGKVQKAFTPDWPTKQHRRLFPRLARVVWFCFLFWLVHFLLVFCRDWPAVNTLVLVWWQLIEIALYIRLQLVCRELHVGYIFSPKLQKANVTIARPTGSEPPHRQATRDDRLAMIGEAVFGKIRRLFLICSILMGKTNFMGLDVLPCVSGLSGFFSRCPTLKWICSLKRNYLFQSQ